jgi:dihydrofolate reductase
MGFERHLLGMECGCGFYPYAFYSPSNTILYFSVYIYYFSFDTIFFGRVSYEMWRQSSPDANADPSIEFLNRIIRQKKKYVFSRTMKKDDESVSIVDSDMENKVREIKTQPGRDIWLYGGANLITSFANLGLIDVYRLAVHPVVLGDGKPLFTDIKKRINLKQPRPPLTNQVWCSWFLKPNDPALAKARLPL